LVAYPIKQKWSKNKFLHYVILLCPLKAMLFRERLIGNTITLEQSFAQVALK